MKNSVTSGGRGRRELLVVEFGVVLPEVFSGGYHDVVEVGGVAPNLDQRVASGGQGGQHFFHFDRVQLELFGDSLHDITMLEEYGVRCEVGVGLHKVDDFIGYRLVDRNQLLVVTVFLRQYGDVDRAEVGNLMLHVVLLWT